MTQLPPPLRDQLVDLLAYLLLEDLDRFPDLDKESAAGSQTLENHQ